MKKFLLVAVLLATQVASAGVQFMTAKSVTCAADGSSTQVLAAAASRASYLLINNSAGSVRFAAKASGTPDLTDADSVLLSAGQSLSDGNESVFVGRIVCMSNDASTRTIYVIETRKTS